MKKISVFFAFGWIFLTACSSIGQTPIPPSPQSTATAVLILPTPSSPGNFISWDNLQVAMDQPEFTEVYKTDYGSTKSLLPEASFFGSILD